MKPWILLCLVGTASFWAWALTGEPTRAELPEEFVGAYRLYRFEPPAGASMTNPYAGARTWFYELRRDGTYSVYVRLPSGYEMTRSEGVVVHEDGVISLHRMSNNLFADKAEPEPYRVEWRQDTEGRFLFLTHEINGHQLFWRALGTLPPLPEPRAAANGK